MVSVVRVLFCAVVLFTASVPAALADAPKLALIITNQSYPSQIGSLENTHRDGERMSTALKALGFITVHMRDLEKAAMVSAVADYVERLEKAGPDAVGFFYYAGHGAANSKYGENYLIPVAAPIASDTQLALQAIKLGEIIDTIAATSVKANFVVFDACRNVPIRSSVRSATRGLRPESHRQGMLIAFATDPGKTATDEGVYAESLTEEMQKPGVLATEVFRAVRSRVLTATGNRQFPWIEDGLIENMYFKPSAAENAPSGHTAPIPQVAALPADALAATRSNALTPADMTLIATIGGGGADKEKGIIGVRTTTWEKSWSTAFGVKPFEGALVAKALDGGAAFAAGIRPLDIITGIDREPIDSARGLAETVSRRRPGTKVEVHLRRVAEDKEAIIEQLRKGAERNDLAAIKLLATLNRQMLGTPQDISEAAQLYHQAANLGDADAMTNLARMYQKGDGVTPDQAEAVRLYRKAADLGDAGAMTNLARIYQKGDGVTPDQAEAVRLYRKATDLGDADAMINLAHMYQKGDGVTPDLAEAVRLYKKAADLGNASAMNDLGVMHAKGEGVTPNQAEAVRLYRKAADLGNKYAINNLGVRYDRGQGVPKDKAEAARLYRKAADLGNANGAQGLANLYDRGEGVEQNHIKAVELILSAIRKKNDVTLKQAPFAAWSVPFRREVQQRLKAEGVYRGPIDGKASNALKEAVEALAARSKAASE